MPAGSPSPTAPRGPLAPAKRAGWCRTPHHVFDHVARLRVAGLAVYCALCHFANRRGEAWPSVRTLARKTMLSPTTVRAALRRLVDAGLVTITSRRSKAGDDDTHLYVVRDLTTSVSRDGVGQTGTHRGLAGTQGGPEQTGGGGSNGDHERDSVGNKNQRRSPRARDPRARGPERLQAIIARMASEAGRPDVA